MNCSRKNLGASGIQTRRSSALEADAITTRSVRRSSITVLLGHMEKVDTVWIYAMVRVMNIVHQVYVRFEPDLFLHVYTEGFHCSRRFTKSLYLFVELTTIQHVVFA